VVAVRAAFQRYGTRRLRAKMQVLGWARICRTLTMAGLRAQQPLSFVPRTTDSDPAALAAPNRLLGQLAPPPPTGCE